MIRTILTIVALVLTLSGPHIALAQAPPWNSMTTGGGTSCPVGQIDVLSWIAPSNGDSPVVNIGRPGDDGIASKVYFNSPSTNPVNSGGVYQIFSVFGYQFDYFLFDKDYIYLLPLLSKLTGIGVLGW